MGRGSSKTRESRMAKIKQVQSDLTKAKAAETKAEKRYMMAEGAVIMFQWNDTPNDQQRYINATTKRNEALKKYVGAQEKRERLQRKLDKMSTRRRSAGAPLW